MTHATQYENDLAAIRKAKKERTLLGILIEEFCDGATFTHYGVMSWAKASELVKWSKEFKALAQAGTIIPVSHYKHKDSDGVTIYRLREDLR